MRLLMLAFGLGSSIHRHMAIQGAGRSRMSCVLRNQSGQTCIGKALVSCADDPYRRRTKRISTTHGPLESKQ